MWTISSLNVDFSASTYPLPTARAENAGACCCAGVAFLYPIRLGLACTLLRIMIVRRYSVS